MARQPNSLSPAERLQPQAAPTQSYVDPGEQTGGASLLRALSSVNPALGQLADRMAQTNREKQEALVEGKIGGMTFDQFKAARTADPTLGFTGAWARAALDKQFGMRLGHEVRRKAETELATADLTETNPEEFVARHMEEAAGQLGDSKFAASGFRETTAQLLDKTRDAVNAKRVVATVETRNDNASQNFLGAVEKAEADGLTPQQLVANLRAQQQQNRDALQIGYPEQDKLMEGVLATLAQRPGMEGYIAEIGKMDRGGVKLSTQLGPRFEAFTTAAEAKSLETQKEGLQSDIARWTLAADEGTLDEKALDAAIAKYPKILGGSYGANFKIRNKNAREQQLAQATAALQSQGKEVVMAKYEPDLVSAAMQGRIAEVQDITEDVAGKTIDISRKDAKDHGLKLAAAQLTRDGTAQGLPPERVRANVVEMYGRNGEIDPDTEARISALLHGTAPGGDTPASVLNYLPELALVSQVAPHMVERIVGNETDRLFIDTITTGMELGNDPKTAMATAVWRRDNKALIKMPSGSPRTKMVAEMIDGIDGGGWGGQSKVANPGLLKNFVEDRLDYFYATGATGSVLKKKVEESFLRTHVNLNGQLIDVSGTGVTPFKAAPVLQSASDAISRARPELKGQKVTFIPMGRGSDRFQAVTITGLPIPGTTRTWAEMADQAERDRTASVLTKGKAKAGLRAFQNERAASEDYGAGAPGSMIDAIK